MKLISTLAFLFLIHLGKSQSLSPERVSKIKESTVRITIEGSTSVGTGFFINENGAIVTCYHVIQPAFSRTRISRIFAELNSGQVIEVGVSNLIERVDVLKQALGYDFIILFPINVIPTKYPFLKLGNFDSAKEGDAIYTCGYPIGIKQQFVSTGIVSTKYVEDSNKIWIGTDTTLMPRNQALLDITLNRGNSGGAIIKMGENVSEDEVIGIADFIITPVGSQSDAIIKLLIERSGGITLSGVDPNMTFAKLFDIVSSLSIGVSGCVSINYALSLLGHNN